MSHLSANTLRMYLDRELPEQQRNDVEQHLAGCSTCAGELAALAARAARVNQHLASLAPAGADSPRPARQMLTRIHPKETIPMQKRIMPRAAWAALAVTAVLAVSLTFQPVRALAADLLGLFRVQQVTTLPVDVNSLQSLRENPTAGEAISQLFADSVKVTREETEARAVNTPDEAAALVGFNPRLPAEAPGQASYLVQPGTAFTFTVDKARADELLKMMGPGDLAVPAELDGAKVDVTLPDSLLVSYGSCDGPRAGVDASDPDDAAAAASLKGCLTLAQMPAPSVSTDAPVNLTELAAIGLQVMGMDEQQARQVAGSVDWATTLVIPIPRGQVSASEVNVDGVTGQLLTQTEEGMPGFTLVWVRAGMLYALTGFGDPQPALDLANGLK